MCDMEWLEKMGKCRVKKIQKNSRTGHAEKIWYEVEIEIMKRKTVIYLGIELLEKENDEKIK